MYEKSVLGTFLTIQINEYIKGLNVNCKTIIFLTNNMGNNPNDLEFSNDF